MLKACCTILLLPGFYKQCSRCGHTYDWERVQLRGNQRAEHQDKELEGPPILRAFRQKGHRRSSRSSGHVEAEHELISSSEK